MGPLLQPKSHAIAVAISVLILSTLSGLLPCHILSDPVVSYAHAQDLPDNQSLSELDPAPADPPEDTDGPARSQMTLAQIRRTDQLPAPTTPSDYQPAPEALELYQAARELLEAGDLDDAEKKLQQAAQLDSFNYQVHLAFANLAAARGRFDKAEVHLTKAREIDPDHMEIHVLHGRIADSRSQQDRAIRHYALALLCSDATDDNPRTAAVLLEISQLLSQEGYTRAALETYQRLLTIITPPSKEPFLTAALRQLASQPARLWLIIAGLHAELDESDQALEAYEKALSLSQDNSQIRPAAASGLADLGQFDRALQIANDLALAYRDRPTAAMLILRIREEQGQLPQAVDDLKNLRSRFKDDSRIAIILASCYRKLDQPDDARQTLVDEINFNERFILAYRSLAGLELDQGRRLDAVKWLAKMVRARNSTITDAQWRIKRIAGTTDQAEQLLSELQQEGELHSDFALSWAAAIVAETAEMSEQAQSYYRRAVDLYPSFEPLYISLVRLHLQLNQPDQALAAIRQVHQINPSATDFYRMEGLAHLLRQDTDSAIVSLSAAVAVQPQDDASREALAGALMAVVRPDQAAKHLAMLADKDPENQSLQRQLANAYLSDGRGRLAAETIRNYMADHQINPKTSLVAARALLVADMPQEALKVLRQITVPPELAPSRRSLLLQALIKSDQLDQALQDVRDWLEQTASEKHRANLAAAFAAFLADAGHEQPAVELARKELQASPDNPILRETLIHILLAQKEYQQSDDLISDWLTRNTDRSVRRLKVALLISKEDYTQAEQEIDTLLTDDPRDIQALHQLASLYEASGRSTQAAQQYEKIIAIDPDDIWANNNLGYYLANTDQRLPEAEQLIRTALYRAGPEASVIDSMAWLFYKRGRFGQALEYLSRSIRLAGDPQAELFLHLGDTYYRLDESEKAIEAWKKALQAEQTRPKPDPEQVQALQNRLSLIESGKPPLVAWSVVDAPVPGDENLSPVE